MTRTSTGKNFVPPTRRSMPPSSTRSRRTWRGRGHLSYFVQKQGAAFRHFKIAGTRGLRSGKRPLLVTKQFTVQQAFRNGSAVDLDQGAVPARGKLMNHIGHSFLAHACFPHDQNGAVHPRSLFGHPPHPRQSRAQADLFPASQAGYGRRRSAVQPDAGQVDPQLLAQRAEQSPQSGHVLLTEHIRLIRPEIEYENRAPRMEQGQTHQSAVVQIGDILIAFILQHLGVLVWTQIPQHDIVRHMFPVHQRRKPAATLYLLETLTVLVSDMEIIVPPSGVQNRALMRTTGRNWRSMSCR